MKTLEEMLADAPRENLDIAEIPSGHELRFQARLRRRERKRVLAYSLATLTAAAMLTFALTLDKNSFDKTIPSGDNCESVYASYLSLKDAEYKKMLARGGVEDTEWYATFSEVSDESINLGDLLPNELSESEKTALMKEHYGKILSELVNLNKEYVKLK